MRTSDADLLPHNVLWGITYRVIIYHPIYEFVAQVPAVGGGTWDGRLKLTLESTLRTIPIILIDYGGWS
jgi:hypothetical protein